MEGKGFPKRRRGKGPAKVSTWYSPLVHSEGEQCHTKESGPFTEKQHHLQSLWV